MDDKVIQLPVTLDGYSRKKDRSVKLSFSTLFEVNNDDLSVIDTFHQDSGHLLFRKNSFKDDEVPQEDVATDLKSSSQRLRNILYVYHMEKDGHPEKFRQFYESTIEKYIDRIKEELS